MFNIKDIVKNKYIIESILGTGKMAKTFLAKDKNTNKKVVVKVLQLKGLPEWKILELFEREAEILKSIKHPKIPNYIDYFKEEEQDNIIYFLIYEYIEGRSLNSIIESGNRFDYKQVENILVQLLEILQYLHSHIPPVIHRDINPNNIIMKENTKEVYLVDFGAVKNVTTQESIEKGTTLVGTYGYIPLEQLTGEAYPQSDIYALGMTAINLLTGQNPTKFQMKELKPDYRGGKPLHDLDRIIDMMIEPDINKRVDSASKLLSYIKSGKFKSNNSNAPIYTSKKNKETMEIGDSYYEDMGRLKVQTFDDIITLIVTSEENLGLRKKPPNQVAKNIVRFLARNSWVLIVAGIIAFINLKLPWFFFPLLFIFVLPIANRFIKQKYSQYEDVEIKISPTTITVPRQLDPVRIDKVKDIYIQRKYSDGKVNLKVVLKVGSEEKHFYISNLTEEEATQITNFIIRNIEIRKKLLFK